MVSLSEWQPFLAVQAGAAATLTGLVFVSVSINLKRIMEVPGLPGRGAESIVQLLQVFFVSALTLVPRWPPGVLGGGILAVALTAWLVQTVAQVRYSKVRGDDPRQWLLTRVIATQLATIPFCVASVVLFLGNLNGLYWLVPGFVLSFVASVVSAWVLLVEILR